MHQVLSIHETDFSKILAVTSTDLKNLGTQFIPRTFSTIVKKDCISCSDLAPSCFKKIIQHISIDDEESKIRKLCLKQGTFMISKFYCFVQAVLTQIPYA